MNIAGLILMGGQNSRMNGEKKALLKYKDKYFYKCVSEAMAKAGVEQIYASVEKIWEQALELPQLVDGYAQIGPLGGIVTALEKLVEQEQRADGILVVPCDLPKIAPELLEKLMVSSRSSGRASVLFSEGWPNPLVAIYTKDCLPVLKAQIAEGNYRATHWIKLVEHAEVVLDDADIYMISNINSKKDYAALEE